MNFHHSIFCYDKLPYILTSVCISEYSSKILPTHNINRSTVNIIKMFDRVYTMSRKIV